ncbi:MAG: ABC transporter permease [Victivallales bacterium]|nr:ABC transporter permease [Victivallales bacterium]
MRLQLFSPARFVAVVIKEFIQVRRDRVTLGMMIGIPLVQLVIFGFAINTNPKYLPTAVVDGDMSTFTRSIVSAMNNSEYFRIDKDLVSEKEATALLRRGEVQFIVTFPENFTRELLRGRHPQLLLQADASDPGTVGYAVSSFQTLAPEVLRRDYRPVLPGVAVASLPLDIRVQRCFNPEIETPINVVPGLLGVILTMTMAFITALSMTREKERGTMETLLSTPVRPLEVMLGKIVPYLLVGYVQIGLILVIAWAVFDIRVVGSLPLLLLLSLFFIAANLAVGVTISTIARNQVQAVQMSIFFFLPSILLSGFMFPRRGMPEWAQWIGTALPLTHYLQIVRGIILRGTLLNDLWTPIMAMIVFFLIVVMIGLARYRQTLD